MRIKKINLIGFGHFRNVSYNLDPGLTIVYGLNGSGKSTIHQFIFAIFYGFRKSWTKSQTYREEYSLYKPLDGGPYQGSLDFEYEEKTYRIYRNFAKNEETCKVYDLDQNLDITDELDLYQNSRSGQPGLAFFSCNEEVFRQVYYMPQLGLGGPGGSRDSLSNYFSYVYLASSAKELEDFFEEIEKRDKGLGKKSQSRSPLGHGYGQIESLDQALFQLNEKIYKVKMDLSKAEKNSDKAALDEEIDQLKSQLAQAKESPSLKEKDRLEKYQALKGKALYYRGQLAKLKLLDQEGLTEKGKTRLLALKAYRKNKVSYLSLSLGLGLILCLLSHRLFQGERTWPILIFLFFLPLLGLGLWLTLQLVSYHSMDPKSLALIKEDPSLLEKSLTRGQAAYDQVLNEIEALEDQFPSLLIGSADQETRLTRIQDHLIESLKARQDLALQDQALAYKTDALDEYLVQRQEIEEKRRRVQDQVKTMEKEKEVLAYLKEEMTRLRSQKDMDWEEGLLKKASSYLDFLTQGSLKEILGPIDKLSITREKGQTLDFPYLSQGTQDLVAFSIRLAMASFAPKGLFFLMDESFNQLDTVRLKRVWALLDHLGKDLQILYFTSRKEDLYSETGKLINLGGDYE